MSLRRFIPRRAGALLGAFAALSWGDPALAYCPEVTEDPPADYDPTTRGCFTSDPTSGLVLPTLFWRNLCVGYSLQRGASSQVSLSEATRVAAKAFATWSAAACASGAPSISAVALPPVDCDVVPSQGHGNVIIFRDGTWPYTDGANALGITKLTVNKTTGEIYGADIEVNATKILVADPPAPQGAYDSSTILTHESGHFLGLAHSADSTAVMYAFYHRGSTALALDDVAGICSIYPPGGTRATGGGPVAATACDPAPRNGFSTTCDGIDGGAVDGALPGADASQPGIGAGDADAGPCEVGLFSCATTGERSRGGSGLAGALGAVAAGAGAVFRRSRRRRRAALEKLGIGAALVIIGAGVLADHDARASVSITVTFEELVERATAVAVVTPGERRVLREGSDIVTYTRVHVDRLVAGRLQGDVWVRTLGGEVGDVAQLVEGEATFAPGRPSLVFLRPHVDPVTRAPTGAMSVVERAQGQFPIETDARARARLALARDLGALVPPSGRAVDGGASRFARDVLEGRSVDDAARAIAAAWRLAHGGLRD